MNPVRPGYKTTEFWLTVLSANVAPAVLALSGALPPQYALVATAVGNGLYAVGRGIAKQQG